LAILPKITPAIGELDYCIPGPNPSWEIHASEAKSEYLNYIGGFSTEIVEKEKGKLGRSTCKVIGKYFSAVSLGIFPEVDCNAPIQEFLVPPDPSGYNAIFKNTSILKSNQAQEFYKLLPEGVQKQYEIYHNQDDLPIPIPGLSGKWVPLQELLNSQVNKWNYVVRNLYDDYADSIKDTYSPMTNPDAGSQYLQMAANGMKITKDLDLYAENTASEIIEYETQVSTAKSNKIQLCLIKKQVVKKANDRRNAERAARGEPLVSLSCSLPPQSTYVDPCGEVPPTETKPPASQCSDGKDNDQDGGTDGGDASCHTDNNASNIASYDQSINDEGRGNPAPACSNGEDDDGDGKIDDNDLGCYIDGKYDRNRNDEKPYIEPR
jgi:hypothetical protein